MLTKITFYIFKTFRPEFQLIIQLGWAGGGRLLSMMAFKIMRFSIIFCISETRADISKCVAMQDEVRGTGGMGTLDIKVTRR